MPFRSEVKAAIHADPKRCNNCGKPTDEKVKWPLCPRCRAGQKRRSNAYYEQARDEALAAYGGPVCACCGETEPKFLSLDHTNGNGAEHRASHRGGGSSNFYVRIRREGYPPGLRVLCMNCNHGRHRNGGVCPHEGVKP